MIQAKDQASQVRLDEDKSRLNDLLDRYGCTATDAGWRRLTILLAFEVADREKELIKLAAGRFKSGDELTPSPTSGLSTPAFKPEHDIPLLTEALVIEASKTNAPNESDSAAARGSMTYLAKRLGIPKTWKSLRAQYGQHKKLVRDLVREGGLIERPWSALDLLSAYPPQRVGEAQLREASVQRLAAISATMNYDPSGRYGFDNPLQLIGDTYLQFITVRCGAEVQRLGAPAHGSDAGAVELVLSRPDRRKSAEGAVVLSLETFTTERLKPERCQLQNEIFCFEAKHSVLGLVQLAGELRNDGLLGELVISPPQRPSVKIPFQAERHDPSL